jgi:hypothetical protein
MKQIALFMLCGAGCLAHDTYLMPAKFVTQPGKPLLVSVHNGDSFPRSEHATDPRRLVCLKLSDGTVVSDLQIAGRATHGTVTVPGKGSMYVIAETQPKLIEMTAPKFAAYLREEGLPHAAKGDAVVREIYRKYAKAYLVSDAPDAGYAKPAGLAIEIVPEADPASLRAGSELPVRVLFRGAPLPNAQMEKAWTGGRAVVGRTDSGGRLRVPVDSAGKWRLHVVHMEPARETAKADWESYWASLTFEVGQ